MLTLDTIYNMDCIEGMRLMQAQGLKANMLLTDIPYAEVNRADNGLRSLDKGKADELTFDLEEYLRLTDSVVSGSFIVFCATEQVSTIRRYYDRQGYTTRIIVWEKTNPSPMNGEHIYLSGIELAVYAKKPSATFNAFCKNTVFRYPTEKCEWHDTQKPLRLWYDLIRDNTNEGDLILDTCMGGGTTAVAAHKMSRRFIGFELDKTNYDKGQIRVNRELNQISFFDLINDYGQGVQDNG